MLEGYLKHLMQKKEHELKRGQRMSTSISSIQSAGQGIQEIASIFVYRGDSVLIGKRKDCDKYTLPGGYIKENESPYQGAVRELYEETNLRVEKEADLSYFGPIYTSKNSLIHLFLLNLAIPFDERDQEVSTKNDPDDEVYEWEFMTKGSARWNTAMFNLYSTVNESFKALGLME